MRSSNLLFSCVHLTVTLLIIAFGLSLVVMPYAEGFRLSLAQFFATRPAFLFSLGLVIMGSGIFLLVAFFFMHKKRYFKVGMECGKALIEESIIRDYVFHYWESVFPQRVYDLEIVLGGQKLEIISTLPKGVTVSKELFEQIRRELGVILARRLGYEKEFILTITD